MSEPSGSVAEQAIEITLPDLAATDRLAGALAALARPGDVIGLEGPLGAGKTTFARAFIRALLERDEEVPSPTFTLVQIYEAPKAAVYHFDLYRLDSHDDAWELGIEDAFAEAISLIEWPDRLGPLMPADALHVALRHDPAAAPEARTAALSGGGSWPRRIEALSRDAHEAMP